MCRNCYFILIMLALCQCTLLAEDGASTYKKIDGISIEASRELIGSADLLPVSGTGAEWVALMPYGFVRKDEGIVHFNTSRQWIGERVDGIEQDIEACRRDNLKVMLKPHVWVSRGEYTGDYVPEEVGWKPLEDSYMNYILEFARVAEDCHVELFCMGTEWRKFIQERPEFWSILIDSVRNIYSGQLTYAANWDEYKETPFWGKLDYIGVNAYFPLSKEENPTVEELVKAWTPIKSELSTLSAQKGKPVLFTEYGYRSVSGTTIKPWDSYNNLPESYTEQQKALEGLFNGVWQQEWLAGGFLWKWHTHPPRWGRRKTTDFTPQEKPALEVIKKWYRNN